MNQLIQTEDDWMHEMTVRACKLNANDGHYFVGWLVSAGFQKPDVMAAIDWVLDDMETDPSLEHCWAKECESEGMATIHDEVIVTMENEVQELPCAVVAHSVSEVLPCIDMGSIFAPVAQKSNWFKQFAALIRGFCSQNASFSDLGINRTTN